MAVNDEERPNKILNSNFEHIIEDKGSKKVIFHFLEGSRKKKSGLQS